MGATPLASAVALVGGQAQLARLLGISQPHVWHWLHKAERVPAEHVIAIEKATGGKITRHELRPDLYPASESPRPAVADEDRPRADCYQLLGRLLALPPEQHTLDSIGRMLGGAGEFGAAIDALAKMARDMKAASVEREYHELFIGVARGELVPFASYYRTGFLYDKPLAKLRGDMGVHGIEPADHQHDPEDHIGSLCEMMAGLILGTFGPPAELAAQRKFFDAHLAPWADRFFSDLERAKHANFYKPVGTVGRLFVAIESEAYALAA